MSMETMAYPHEAMPWTRWTIRDECAPWKGRCPMASKRSRKVQKRRKTLQRWRQRAATTRRPLSQIPPESADQVAMTTTGEILQLIRLHYGVLDVERLQALFASLRCLEYDASQTRWVWL